MKRDVVSTVELAQRLNMSAVDGRRRLIVAGLGFLAVYGVIGAKLAYFGMKADPGVTGSIDPARQQLSLSRPDLLDRNGEVLATDIKTSSLYAEPRRILASVGPDEVLDALSGVLPGLRSDPRVVKRLSSKAGFVWVKRDITGEQKQKIFNLGLPGIGFMEENKRFYPGRNLATHVLGLADTDNLGVSGLERYIDAQSGISELQRLGLVSDRGMQPKRLSLDMRVQHVVHDEVAKAMEKHRAKAGMGIVLNAQTGEVLAMVSLPDYDLNAPGDKIEEAHAKDYMNRATVGVYEMGSVFKTFNTAMALDTGKVKLSDVYPISGGIQIGRQHISEFHSKGRPLNVPEIFIYSSNTGSARMALKAGAEAQRDFFERVGFHAKLDTELPELSKPLFPKRLSDISTATQSLGHGISVTPMHTAVAAVAMINGGLYIPPTFFPRTREAAEKVARRVIKPETSAAMRYVFRLNVEQGSGKRAEAEGYRVGGKTGTAEKIDPKTGKYAKGRNFNSFLAAFPMDDPQYVVLVVLDEPKAEGGEGAALAGSSAAPPVGAIVGRVAGMLGIQPRFDVKPLPPAGGSGMTTHE